MKEAGVDFKLHPLKTHCCAKLAEQQAKLCVAACSPKMPSISIQIPISAWFNNTPQKILSLPLYIILTGHTANGYGTSFAPTEQLPLF